MARFEFRFASIQRLHEQLRDEARRELAKAQQAVEMLDQRARELAGQRAELRERNVAQLQGAISVDALLDTGRYDAQLQAQQKQLSEQRVKILEEVERRRDRLVHAERECRKFEKLKELAWQRHQVEERRREQAELDEIASRRGRNLFQE